MASGNGIVVSSEPRGRFDECIISGTPKPGTCMSRLAATEPVGGRYTYEAYNPSADGEQLAWGVLLPDDNQGRAATAAYAAAERGFLYFPVNGDELNCLVANIAGTGDAFAIGDKLMIDDGTGKLIATTGSPETESFEVLETKAALTADTLVHVQYNGN